MNDADSHRPKKSLGQNFLINKGVCRRIISLLNPERGDQILEIGPGAGALTEFLEEAPHGNLVLLEKDDFYAAQRAKTADCNTLVIHMDALKFQWNDLCASGAWKLAGNLPYNIASPLIWDIFSTCQCIKKAVFMVQKEVAERLTAHPGTKSYGALTVWAQTHAAINLEFNVSPESFRPRPKVRSSVVSFFPLPKTSWPREPEALKKILKMCFQNRRKQVQGIFKKSGLERLFKTLEDMTHNAYIRAENITPSQFELLAHTIMQDDPDFLARRRIQ